MMAFVVYSLRVRVIFIANVDGESNTKFEQMWKVMPSSHRHSSTLFSQIIGKCGGMTYKGERVWEHTILINSK